MKNLLLHCLLIIMFLCGCKSHKDISFNKERDVTFDVGYCCLYIGVQTFYNAKNKRTYIAFAEMKTKKKIKIYDDNFKFVKEISTKAPSTEDLNSIEMIALDSVLVKTGSKSNNDIYYLLNGKGEVLNHFIVREHKTNDTNSQKYFYDAVKANPHNFINNNLYIKSSMSYQFNKDLSRDEEDRLSVIEQRKTPLLMRVKLFDSVAKREFYLYDFYKNISGNDDFITNGDIDVTLDEDNMKLLATSCWSDKIFVVNINNMKLEKVVTIKSDYTTIGTKPISNNNTHADKMKAYETAGISNGGIHQVYFDKYRQLYYVITRHTTDSKVRDLYPSWSLHVYDKNFSKIKEIPFKAGEYDFWGSFLIVKQGVLIPKKDNYDEENPIYTLFSVNYTD